MKTTRSRKLFAQAQRLLPGGVNSPVRAFKSVGGQPVFICRGKGSRVWDVDGNDYIDLLGSWGPLLLGHAHPRVTRSARQALERGASFGAATEAEVNLAQLVTSAFPCLEMLRLVSSGTEAVMSALRLARAYTRRDLIVKCAGGYHGHSDGLLSQAGSGLATLGVPASPGVPRAFAALTLTLPYNDLGAAEKLFARRGGKIAAVILEPIAGNMGVVPPAPGYLEGVRRLTRQHGALLIFDEVITGFRVARGGAQQLYGLTPDLTTLGKVLGGGFPIGAYGGRRDIMRLVAPAGPVYQAGTLSGNPVAVAAGIAVLGELSRPGFYEKLEKKSARLERELRQAAAAGGAGVTINRVGSMFTVFFADQAVTDYASALRSDTARYAAFFRAMLGRGIYLPPSQFEAAFLSAAHTPDDIDTVGDAARHAFRSAARTRAP
jgi:glutamate-1-semialdehyde 2,1-aminomutase